MTGTLKLKTNLNCGSCVAKVTPHLDAAVGTGAWSVDTADPDKVLTVPAGASADAVGDAVAKAGFRVLDVLPSPGFAREGLGVRVRDLESQISNVNDTPNPSRAKPGEGWKKYYPLLLILLYLLGGVALLQYASGRFDWHAAMAQFMAGFFLVFSFFKLLDLPKFAAAYAGYDVVAGRWPAYGYVYPFLELALGAAYLSGVAPVATNAATLALMLVSLVGVVRTVLARRAVRCACLGAVFDLPVASVTLLEDGLMAAMAAAMLVA